LLMCISCSAPQMAEAANTASTAPAGAGGGATALRRLIAESGAPAAVTLLPQAAAGAVAQRDRMDGLAHDLIGQLFGEEAAGGRKDLIVYAVAPPEEGGREVAYVRDAHEKLPGNFPDGRKAAATPSDCSIFAR